MVGQKFLIHIKKGVKVVPLNVCTPRKMPIAYLEAAKKKKIFRLEKGCRNGAPDVFRPQFEWQSTLSCGSSSAEQVLGPSNAPIPHSQGYCCQNTEGFEVLHCLQDEEF